jgi:exonuclease III
MEAKAKFQTSENPTINNNDVEEPPISLQSNQILTIFHQNICGLRTKTNEIIGHLSSDLPYTLCFTEHHLSVSEIQSVHIDNYTLGTYYCRSHVQKGGVCIFINNNLISSAINLDKYCIDKDIEACAIQLNIYSKKFYILTIYRSPSGNIATFMTYLELILKLLYNPKIDLIVCGDININYLENSNKVKQLNALIQTYNLIHTVSFPTRISKSSSTAIDIFLDTSKYEKYLISPIYNGLSDHDAQLLTIVLSLHSDKNTSLYILGKLIILQLLIFSGN